jgi:enoyl-CoA hydratase
MLDAVSLDVEDGIALVTLNRPHKLNALNYELIDRLTALLDTIEVEPGVRAVILTGAGDRAFSAGADIHEFFRQRAPRDHYGGPRLRPARTGHDRAA